MSKEKRSFFERLTGAVRMDEAEEEVKVTSSGKPARRSGDDDVVSWVDEESDKDAELTIDVYQTSDMVVVKSMIAGVRPEDLDVSITRDSVTLRGKREEERMSGDGDYLVQELYWGSFSRTVSLPEEIDVDEAEAIEKHGLLILKLPKLDKKRQSKLKVKTV
ncbi:MAG: heat shock protein Hsp20, family protein [Candidatus Parcubacteria bacterium]|nr:heat shock protein Hsp20, family protein [Candidatus Parcubacteria bacterium]